MDTEINLKNVMENKEFYLETGNLDEVNKNYPERKGWVIGKFVEESKLRNSNVYEVKWVRHPRGIKKLSGADLSKGERTMVILILGKWRVKFGNGHNILLSKPGDYVIFDAMAHEAEGLEASHMVVIRWKEI
jgi:hypothetical protein